MALESLSTEQVGFLLESADFSKYREAFAAAEISGHQLELLEKNSELEQLGIKMADLHFKVLLDKISKVG